MQIVWSRVASNDVIRLHTFLASLAPEAANTLIQRLTHAPEQLTAFPRLGERLDAYAPREVRRIFVGRYEMRYEIAGRRIVVLRVWHGRENRADDETL